MAVIKFATKATTMLEPLNEVEKDYSYSTGLVESWLDFPCAKCGVKTTPAQVKENLSTLIAGISSYREKYLKIQEDYADLQQKYNQLMATSAQYLEFMRQQKQQLDEALIDQQREFHNREDSLG